VVEKIVNVVVEKPTIVEKIVEKPYEVVRVVEVEKIVETVRTEIVERIVEKPVEITKIKEVPVDVERIVYQDKFIEVERIVEKPMIEEKVIKIETIKEVPIEVIKIVEVIKEVTKIVYENKGGAAGGEESDCGCLTGDRLQVVWNKLFKLSGPSSDTCITEEEFVGMISKSFVKNSGALMPNLRASTDSEMT
jgi:hypothetical protein